MKKTIIVYSNRTGSGKPAHPQVLPEPVLFTFISRSRGNFSQKKKKKKKEKEIDVALHT